MKKSILKILSYLLVIASFYFIYLTFKRIELSQITFIFEFKWVIIILVASIIYSLIGFLRAYNWERLLFFFSGKKVPARELFSIYLKTEIAKYIPSNLVHFAGRHTLAKKYNYSHTQLLLSNLFDMGLVAAAAALITFLGILTGNVMLPPQLIAFLSWKKLVIIFGAGAILLGLVFYKKKKLIIQKIKEFASWSKIRFGLKIFILYVPVFILSGTLLFYVFVFMGLDCFNFATYVKVIVGYTLAWLAGFIIPGAPGGLGVREAFFILLFSPVFGELAALTAGLILRIITIFGDVWTFFYGNALKAKVKNS